MSLHRTLVTAPVLILVLLLSASAQAVEPGFLHTGDDNSDFTGLYDPFCDLDTCWFEPIYCDCPERPLNSGWFFEYSRTALKVSRPRNVGRLTYDPNPELGIPDPDNLLTSIYTSTDGGDLYGDLGWGNRFDFGWVSDEGTGIWIVARKLDSPDERVTFQNTSGVDLAENALPETFATVNGLRMWGVEGNKTWRLTPTPKGTVMEPFVGLRYVRLRDHSDRDDIFNNFDRLQFPATNPPASLVRTIGYNFRQSTITTDNDLFGGQFGLRSRWRRGRWQVTSDIRGLMFWNHQVKETISDNQEQTENFLATYDATGLTGVASTGVLIQESSQDQTFDSNNTFVYGGELNLQLAFEVTQGFSINVGGEIIAFADGVGRGPEGVDDSLLLTGLTMGFSFNR